MLLKSSDPPLATSSSTDLENSSQNNNLGSLQRKAISSTSLTSSHLKKFVSRIDARKKDAVTKAALEDKKANAAGILGGNLGLENYAKFITDKNVREPHLIWLALLQHFQSNSSQNQVVVYQDFLKIGFNSTLEQFIKDIDVGISNICLVGIKIVKFEKSTLD
ncbi:hypothetical protein PGT21_035549 [Puccinia graminis f. sp. tritici]|uniref:Uncharacterized protein n=1 Tax=Puccinia graminis f. sp. tritici TaxID=56615 RepID=A0A5B0PA38_PUCGR|nr:hypothetical protein PGT21_035549 [Puccinia graminis f. sp. tritici]